MLIYVIRSVVVYQQSQCFIQLFNCDIKLSTLDLQSIFMIISNL